MNKTAIISDVHGNLPALESVLEQIDKLKCDRIISLGDVSGYYCMVNECIDIFRHRGIINLLGNHDAYLINNIDCLRSHTVNYCINYQRKIISDDNLRYLKESCATWDQDGISARHGGWHDPLEEYVNEFDFGGIISRKEIIYCSGHTHIQKMSRRGVNLYFNPGSVGQPRDRDKRAGFAVVEADMRVSLYRVDYDIDRIMSEMKACGFESRIYECLLYGTKIGEK